ncbi:MAG: hypothetical protein L0Y58_11360 [Verrucomicrobia subdivision 3 bacterium]|nr:hypothetical protein [Limisphaerales bacterium]
MPHNKQQGTHKHQRLWCLWFALCYFALARNCFGASYETGFPTIARLSQDLLRALEKEQRNGLVMPPILLENVRTPYLQPGEQIEGKTNHQAVFISAATIDVLNYVAHANAIDRVDPGFLKKAINSLATANGEELAALYQPTHHKAWSFNTMNQQASHFNQMAGCLVAIDMAHHYLGHYKKYAKQLGSGKNLTPLYSVITPQDWREAVLRGSRHALDCALAPEGLIVFYDALSRMPTRPAWSLHFMPPAAEVMILRLELQRVEARFFDGRTTSGDNMIWTW